MTKLDTAKLIVERVEQCNNIVELTNPCLSMCREIYCDNCPVVRPIHCIHPLLMLVDARRFILARGS
jgi:hypothetical protein